jgi:hypothetical protein
MFKVILLCLCLHNSWQVAVAVLTKYGLNLIIELRLGVASTWTFNIGIENEWITSWEQTFTLIEDLTKTVKFLVLEVRETLTLLSFDSKI